MELETSRFGKVALDNNKLIKFAEGIPGLEYLKTYVLINDDTTWPIYFLQSTEDAQMALPVISSFEVLEDYSLDISDAEVDYLKLDSVENLMVLNVVTVPEQLDKMTCNLAAPILVNTKMGIGKQILIDGNEYPIRHPIYVSVMKVLEGVTKDAGSISEN